MISYGTVLVGVDFSELGEIALEAAVSFVQRAGAKRLHLVHVVPALQWTVTDPSPQIERAWNRALELQTQRLLELKVPPSSAAVTRATCAGSPADMLLREANRIEAELIVVAAHHRPKIARFALGSVANALLRSAPCPLWIVSRESHGTAPIRNVLAAIDTSFIAPRVLEHAVSLAAPERGSVCVLSAADPPQITGIPASAELIAKLHSHHYERIADLAGRARTPAVDVTVNIVSGSSPAEAILARAEATHPDALVIGTSGHHSWKRMFLGSTATRVVANAPCPLLVVPCLVD